MGGDVVDAGDGDVYRAGDQHRWRVIVVMSGGWRSSSEGSVYVLPSSGESAGCTGLWADVSDMGQSASSPNALDALRAASYLLWVMSGRKYSGVCVATEAYSCEGGFPCCGGAAAAPFEYAAAEAWMQQHTGSPGWGRSPGQRVLFLRNRPVRELLSLSVNGVEADLSLFSVYDRAFVAPASLSCCDPMFDPCCAVVSYSWGTKPPVVGRLAVLELADQFVKAVECPSECKLPERITSVSRQGVSFQVFDPQDFLNEGRTGLYSVDLFLKTVNPDGAKRRARVFSPDMPQGRRVSSGGGVGRHGW